MSIEPCLIQSIETDLSAAAPARASVVSAHVADGHPAIQRRGRKRKLRVPASISVGFGPVVDQMIATARKLRAGSDAIIDQGGDRLSDNAATLCSILRR